MIRSLLVERVMAKATNTGAICLCGEGEVEGGAGLRHRGNHVTLVLLLWWKYNLEARLGSMVVILVATCGFEVQG